jgi:hypothetical protein
MLLTSFSRNQLTIFILLKTKLIYESEAFRLKEVNASGSSNNPLQNNNQSNVIRYPNDNKTKELQEQGNFPTYDKQ